MLSQYLKAINVKRTETFGTKEFAVHNGYYKTIERQIESGYLPQKELLCILSLYDIDYIPEFIIEQPIILVGIPQPRILLDGIPFAINLNYAPQPRIILRGVALPMTFIPQPKIYLDIPEEAPQLVFAPQPRIVLTGVPSNLEMIFAPQPRIKIVEEEIISLVFIPQPRIRIDEVAEGVFYYGFAPYNNDGARSVDVSYVKNNISTMLTTSNMGDDGYLQKANIDNINELIASSWQKNIPVGEVAYMTFLIPTAVGQRTSMLTPIGGEVQIGSTLDESISGNEFPEPDDTVTIKGINYYLYVGNRRRRYSGTYKLIR